MKTEQEKDLENIRSYKTISWSTIRRRNAEGFKSLLREHDPNLALFDEDYVKELSSQVKDYTKLSIKIYFLWLVSLVSLYFSLMDKSFPISFFSLVKLDSEKYYLEILFAASALSVAYSYYNFITL